MPKYEYACKSCGERLEVVQSFTDDPLTECPACGGVLRKVFSAPAISFKGKGFYRTDNRQGRPSTETKADTKTDKVDAAAKPETKSETKSESSSSTDSKPAPKASEAKSA
jgi:putative FmdB family regulatory protein